MINTEIMYHIILFDDMMEVRGDEELSYLLSNLSKTDDWKNEFSEQVSAGWHWVDDDKQVHYLKRVALPWVGSYLFTKNKSFFIRPAQSDEYIPLSTFEEWDPPANQEAAITMGYMDVSKDYRFVIPYCHRNEFGAWRVCPPVI